MRACVCVRVWCVRAHTPSLVCLFRSFGNRPEWTTSRAAAVQRCPGPQRPSPEPLPSVAALNLRVATFLNLFEGEAEWREAERGRGEGAKVKVVSFFGSRFCFR